MMQNKKEFSTDKIQTFYMLTLKQYAEIPG